MNNLNLSKHLAQTFRVSMENYEESNPSPTPFYDEDGAVTSPLVLSTGEPILEAQETSLVGTQQVLEVIEEEMIDADADVETLESIYLSLESTLVNNSMTNISYETLNIVMGSIYRKHGIDVNTVMPSMESFNEDQRLQTQISMERVIETAGSIVEGVKALLKKLWFKTKSFILDLFKYGGDLIKRAEAVQKYAKANPRTDVTKVKLHSAAKLEIAGKVPPKAQLILAYKKACPNFDKLTDVVGTQVMAISDMVDGLLNGRMNKVDGVLTDVSRELDRVESVLNTTLVFQKAKVVKTNVSLPKTRKSYAMPKLIIEGGMDARGRDSEAYTTDSMTSDEVITVVDNLILAVKALEKVRKTYSGRDLDSRIVLLSKTTGVPKKRSERNVTDEEGAKKIVSKALRMLLAFNNKYISYMMNVHKAMLDYCVQSTKPKDKKVKNDE